MRNAFGRSRVDSRRGGPRRVAPAWAALILAVGVVLSPQAAAAQECDAAGCAGSPAPTGTPAETSAPTPSGTPAPDGDGDRDGTGAPTPASTSTPTPTPTPTPTQTPTPTPTPTPKHTPTPSRTPVPTPTAAAPVPTDDVPLAIPDLQPGVTVDPAQVERAAQLATDLATAQQALADATKHSQTAQHEQDQASAAAEAAKAQAAAAEKRAESSAAFAIALIRTAGSKALQPDPLAAVLSTPGDLLSKLAAVDRLKALAADRDTAIKAAAIARATADRLNGDARQARSAVAAIDVAGSERAVADARGRVDAAATALASLPTVITAGQGWRSLIVDLSAVSGGWTLPVHGPLTDGFGPRPSRPAGTALFHPGDDIGAACGTTIVAAAAGTVLAAGPNGSYGNFVLLDNGGGVQTAYGHIRDGGLGVIVGQKVAAGQAIAQVGTTGASTGCHLHFEVRVNGVQIDPMPFLAARGVAIGTR